MVASPSGSGRFFSRPRSLPICFFVLSPCPKMCVVQLCERKGKLCLKQAGGRHIHCCQQHMHIDSCFVCWREKLSYFSSVREGMLLCFCNLRKPRDSLSCSVPLEQGYALAHGTTYKCWVVYAFFYITITSCTTSLKSNLSGGQHTTI